MINFNSFSQLLNLNLKIFKRVLLPFVNLSRYLLIHLHQKSLNFIFHNLHIKIFIRSQVVLNVLNLSLQHLFKRILRILPFARLQYFLQPAIFIINLPWSYQLLSVVIIKLYILRRAFLDLSLALAHNVLSKPLVSHLLLPKFIVVLLTHLTDVLHLLMQMLLNLFRLTLIRLIVIQPPLILHIWSLGSMWCSWIAVSRHRETSKLGVWMSAWVLGHLQRHVLPHVVVPLRLVLVASLILLVPLILGRVVFCFLLVGFLHKI